jgi:hypothetical protein
MNLNQQEQQILNNFLIGFTQDVDHTILSILFKRVIQDPKEADNILVKCCERYLDATEPFLQHLSKEKIGFGLTCRDTLQRFVLTQLTDTEAKEEFKKTYNIIEETTIIKEA